MESACMGEQFVVSFSATGGGEWEDRVYCTCRSVETLEHVLVKCGDTIWRYHLWNEVGRVLKIARATKDLAWETPSYNWILGIGLIMLGSKQAARLYQITILEATFSIWKMRNARSIRGKHINAVKAIATFYDSMARRARNDFKLLKLSEFKSTAKIEERQ